jgi:2,4-dienoyl-CoA reductase-like NADH-dependent reductase (Old Yellow Enzyme family)
MKLFEPISIRGMEIKNRIVLPPIQGGIGYRGRRVTSYGTVAEVIRHAE